MREAYKEDELWSVATQGGCEDGRGKGRMVGRKECCHLSSLAFVCRTTLVIVKPPWTLKDLVHLLDRCVCMCVCARACVCVCACACVCVLAICEMSYFVQ